MSRFTLTAVGALSLVALIACATSVDDGLGAAVLEETKKVEPEPEGAKLPPSTSKSTVENDAAAETGSSSGSSGTSSSGSSGTSSSGSSGTSSSGSSGTSSSGSSGASSSGSSGSSSSGGTGASCNISDPLKLIVYQIELNNQSAPVPCPCAAGKCCYLGVTCLNQ